MSQCINCGAPVEGTVYRTTLCPGCGRELKTCLNCRHYAPGRPYDCAETIQEPVTDKGRANFCDFFQINNRIGNAPPQSEKGKNPKDDFDALFGD